MNCDVSLEEPITNTADSKEISNSILTARCPANGKNVEVNNPSPRRNESDLLIVNDEINGKGKMIVESAQTFTFHKVSQANSAHTASSRIDFNCFRGLTFALFGFNEESMLELSRDIEDISHSKIVKNLFLLGRTE